MILHIFQDDFWIARLATHQVICISIYSIHMQFINDEKSSDNTVIVVSTMLIVERYVGFAVMHEVTETIVGRTNF